METTDRLSTLSQADQVRVMERVFQKLLLSFGTQLQAKWQGIDMNAVYLDWAESLGQFSLGAINYGITRAKASLKHPPSTSEMIELCREYQPNPNNLFRLTQKMTEEQRQKNRERIEAIAKQFGRKHETV